MENSIIKNTKELAKKQKLIVIVTAGVLLLIFILFISAGKKNKEEGDLSEIIKNSKNKIILQDSSKGIKAEDRWLQQAQGQLDDFDQFMQQSQKESGGLQDRLNNIEQDYQEELGLQSQKFEEQAQEIEALKSKIQDLESSRNTMPEASGQGEEFQIKTIGSFDLNLEDHSAKPKKGFFKIRDYIPAGSYAQATIISGVDASVGISSQSDPRPILLRVKSPAFSSIYDGHLQKADITGCLITGAASGDLSSEKIYVKLVNLTCGKDEETIAEIPVKGYVAGQGKSGVRGHVISREGDLLAKSFLAGLVSGFGQGLSEKVAPPLAFSNGLTTQGTLSTEDVARKGLGKGASTASERLANYLIDRAEQYQPVVSIPSGIDVEVVFLEGFYFNPKEDKTNKTNNPNNI